MVAREIGRTQGAVNERRRELGAPRHDTSWHWTPREIRLLGTINDHELARRLGLTPSQVSGKRTRLGIPPYRPRPAFRRWTPRELRLLGTMTDSELGRRLRRTETSVKSMRQLRGIPGCHRAKRWTRAEEAR